MTMEQSFTFDAEGGCRVSYRYVVPEDSVVLLKEFQRYIGATDWHQRSALQALVEKHDGVTLEGYFTFQQPEGERVQFSFYTKNPRKSFPTGIFGAVTFTDSPKMAGDLVFTAKMPQLPSSVPPEKRQAYREFLKSIGGVQIILRLITPTAIMETTGAKDGFNRTSWRFNLNDEGAILPEIRAVW